MRYIVLLSIVLLVLASGGCQSYRANPPILDSHARAWHQRQPDADGVRAYAQSLVRLNAGARAPFEVSDGLTLEEAESVALLLNPELRVTRLEARVPLLGAREAGRPEDPEFELDLLRILESVSSPWILGTGLRFTVPISGRLQAERARAFAEADAALCAAYVAELSVVTRLRRAWNQWTATGERVVLLQAHLTGLDDMLKIARAQREANQIGGPQLGVLELEQVRRLGELDALRSDQVRQVLALKKLMGLTPDAELALIPALSPDRPALEPQVERAHLRDLNPELALAKARYATAEKALQFEIRKQYPDLKVGPSYENEDGQGRLGAGGGIPLPLWNRNRRAIAESRAERDAARGAYHARYEMLVADLAEARAEFSAAASRSTWLRDRVAPMADRQLNDLRKLGELGDMDVLILKDAMTGVLEAKFQLLDVRLQQAQASTSIQSLIEPLRTPSSRCCAK